MWSAMTLGYLAPCSALKFLMDKENEQQLPVSKNKKNGTMRKRERVFQQPGKAKGQQSDFVGQQGIKTKF